MRQEDLEDIKFHTTTQSTGCCQEVAWLVVWLVVRLFGWLDDCSVVWFAVSLVGCPVLWLFGWLFGRLVVWCKLMVFPSDWLVDKSN